MESVEARKNKLSRRKKAKAKDTLYKAFATVVSEIDSDGFLRNHLFLEKSASGRLAVGGYIIVKTDNGWYDVYKKNMSNRVYKDLFIFDAAMAVVESLNAGHEERVKLILAAEEQFANNYTEMQIFRNAYKNDHEPVFEDRYIIVKHRARMALKEIRKFRIARNSKDR
jgi:hypothetical protein